MFQFPRLSPSAYVFSGGCPGMAPGGFPHSGTPGSQAVCASPGTIAACRALHRLPAPRHPPRAHAVFAFRMVSGPAGAGPGRISLDLASRSQMRFLARGPRDAGPCFESYLDLISENRVILITRVSIDEISSR